MKGLRSKMKGERKSVGLARQTWANVPSSLHSGINMDSWGLLACSRAWFLSTRHLDWPASVTDWQDSLLSHTADKPPELLLFFVQKTRVLCQQHPVHTWKPTSTNTVNYRWTLTFKCLAQEQLFGQKAEEHYSLTFCTLSTVFTTFRRRCFLSCLMISCSDGCSWFWTDFKKVSHCRFIKPRQDLCITLFEKC